MENARYSLVVKNEWSEAGQESRTRLARPNSQARTGIGFPPVQLANITPG